MIKLIASDLDGTLLPEGQSVLDPEIYDVILELKKKGISFICASGRQLPSLQNLFGPVADKISYISENGSLCTLKGQTFVIGGMDQNLAIDIINTIEKTHGSKIMVSCADTCYVKEGNAAFLSMIRDGLNYHTTTIPCLQDIPDSILKVAFVDDGDDMASVTYFSNIFGDKVKVMSVGNSFVDFVPHTCNKALALQFLFEKYGVKPEEVMAFGDRQNDVEMLSLCGISYAMEHSTDDVKKYATGSTDSVVKTLREFIKSGA